MLPLLLAAVLAVGASAPPAPSTVPSTATSTAAAAPSPAAVTDRVVWDLAPRRGSDVRAADLDGTEAVRLYASPDRQVGNLAMSPDGELVAFDTDHRTDRATLLVVPTGGGEPVDVLRGQRRFEGIGPIGWSPDGRSLAFEGFVDRESAGMFYPSYLVTVRADGTDLRVRRRLGDGSDNGAVFGAIAWTRTGFTYSDGAAIRLLRGHRERVLFRRTRELRVSADTRTVVFRRTPARPTGGVPRQRYYRAPSDGGRARLVATTPDPVLGSLLLAMQPDADGSRLLAVRSVAETGGTEVVAFDTDAPGELEVLAFAAGAFSATWG